MIRAIHRMVAGERFVSTLPNSDEPKAPVAPTTGVPENLKELSPREYDVLIELIHGCSNKQIAKNLNLGQPTVKTHLLRVFMKLGAKNRTDAARIGLMRLSRSPVE
jgi:DNA-binding NarL/FixJ family response regulator